MNNRKQLGIGVTGNFQLQNQDVPWTRDQQAGTHSDVSARLGKGWRCGLDWLELVEFCFKTNFDLSVPQ